MILMLDLIDLHAGRPWSAIAERCAFARRNNRNIGPRAEARHQSDNTRPLILMAHGILNAVWRKPMRRMRSLWCNMDGSALVEATIVVPFLFILIFGAFEFSWLFYTHQKVSTGVRDAARYAARSDAPCGSATITDAQNLATTGQITAAGDPRVSGWTAGNVNVACASVDNSDHAYRGNTTITIVTASTNFADNSLGFFSFLGLTVPTIAISHSERAIRDNPANSNP
jgi:Flp pilus assembly protein TadG